MKIPVTTPQAISSHSNPGVIITSYFPAVAGVLSRYGRVPHSTLPPHDPVLASRRKCKTSAEPTNQQHNYGDRDCTHPISPLKPSEHPEKTLTEQFKSVIESTLRPVRQRVNCPNMVQSRLVST